MTAVQSIWFASIAGAMLFFAAGAATMALRRERRRDPEHAVVAPAPMPAPTPSPIDPDMFAEVARLRVALAAAEAAREDVEVTDAEVTAPTARAVAYRDPELTRELEGARDVAVAAKREAEQARARVVDLELQIAVKSDSVRDLSTENEQLKGRLRDAEGLRAEYVRLRTTAAELGFLKSEVARLEDELAATRAAALGAVRPRARGTASRPASQPKGSIGETLASVLDRFADAGTRSIAIGDRQGFVVASSGDDGTALAAHAAQLAEAASRAKLFLPIGAPASIEVMDEHGARVSVWTFPVDGEPLLLASLAVSAPEPTRVEATLADLAAVLTPVASGTLDAKRE
jgi:hypothetical protein